MNALQDTIQTGITHSFYPLYLSLVNVLVKASQPVPLVLQDVKKWMASCLDTILSFYIIFKLQFRKK